MSLQHLVKSDTELKFMRESGAMLGKVLAVTREAVEAGITTYELDEIARKEIKSLGGKPAFYGYNGFPKTACISINQQVVHGIPNHYTLKEGDIISLDCGVNYNGMITDAAYSAVVGKPTDDQKRLVEATEAALYAGIDQLKDNVKITKVSQAIETILNEAKLGIVRDLVGHGTGRVLHEQPEIPNFVDKSRNQKLLAGMTIAIEPMATLGDHRVYVESDNWTVSTIDSSLSAHFEHTIIITEYGSEVLTKH